MERLHTHKIEASELLITDKGEVYHLGIQPKHLADTVITVGDPDRVSKVSQYFDKVTHKAKNREFVCHTGYLGKKHVTVLSTGIGPDNIDIVMNELDALANINFETRTVNPEHRTLSIIRLGTCGSLQRNILVDSMIVSAYSIGLDNLMHFYQYENNADERYILDAFMQHSRLEGNVIKPYIFEGAISLRKHFTADYHSGITITCPGFYGPQGRVLRAPITNRYLSDAISTFSSRDMQALNYEMETAALYGLSKVLGHHCVSISTVVANRADNSTSSNAERAIEQMIKHSLKIIEQI